MTKDKLYRVAMSWALNGNHLKVYAEPIHNDTYGAPKKNSAGKVTSGTKQVHHVKLCIDFNGSKHTGKMIYKQDESLYNAVNDIYVHYYNKRTQ